MQQTYIYNTLCGILRDTEMRIKKKRVVVPFGSDCWEMVHKKKICNNNIAEQIFVPVTLFNDKHCVYVFRENVTSLTSLSPPMYNTTHKKKMNEGKKNFHCLPIQLWKCIYCCFFRIFFFRSHIYHDVVFRDSDMVHACWSQTHHVRGNSRMHFFCFV